MRQSTKESFTNFDIAGELLKLEIALKDLCDERGTAGDLKIESKLKLDKTRRKNALSNSF
jgi:hypothetical protein